MIKYWAACTRSPEVKIRWSQPTGRGTTRKCSIRLGRQPLQKIRYRPGSRIAVVRSMLGERRVIEVRYSSERWLTASLFLNRSPKDYITKDIAGEQGVIHQVKRTQDRSSPFCQREEHRNPFRRCQNITDNSNHLKIC